MATLTRSLMLRRLRETMRDDDEIADMIDGDLEDAGISSIERLTLNRLKEMYTEYIDENGPCITGKTQAIPKKKKGIKNVEHFDAEAILDKRTRTVTVIVEDGDGKFLNSDHERIERPLGGEAPSYMVLPQEVYEAIRRA